MEAWVIKNKETDLYFWHYDDRPDFTGSLLVACKVSTKQLAQSLITQYKLRNFKPVKVRIEEVKE